MKKTVSTLALAMTLALPSFATAEVSASGEVYLGYGDKDGTGTVSAGAFLYGDVNVKGDFGAEGGTGYGFSLDFDISIDEDSSPNASAELDDLTVYVDFGEGGKLSYTTESRCHAGAVPWIDGDLIGNDTDPRGYADSVHTRIGGKLRCVGYVPVVSSGVVKGVKTDGYFKYENKFGKLKTNLYFDPTQEAEGFAAASTITDMAEWEIEMDYNFGKVIGRVNYTELEDIGLWAIFPMPKQGLFSFIRYEEQLAAASASYRWTVFSQWRAKDMGIFKGGTLVYQTNEANDTGYVLQANFGDKDWDASIAFDEDGDYAIEGSYKVRDNVKVVAGYDGGCASGACFNQNDGFGGAAAQDATWELGVKMSF